MEIDLLELRVATLRLLDHLIGTRGVTSVAVDENFYWKVPAEAVFRTDTESAQLDIGSLVDDWGFVGSLLELDKEPIAYQLTELAPILSYIGEKLAIELAAKGG